MTSKLRFFSAVLAIALVLGAPLAARAATLTVVNVDGPNEGFNDPTPVSPVGGNSGTTLGAQRLIVFQTAANIWGSILQSNVEILIQSRFDPLSCDASSAVLGSAGALQVLANFPGAQFTNTWYHIALANALAGSDQITGATGTSADDISAQFNSAIDNNDNCLAGSNWYLGLDNNPPGTDVDLLEVVLHEFGHGLGFANFINESTGRYLGPPFYPDIYSIYTLDISNGLHWNQMSNSQRSASAINTGNVVWDGANVTAEAPNVLGHPARMTINSPGGIAGNYAAQSASFGPAPTASGITGNVVLANDGFSDGSGNTTSDACEPLVNGGAISGNIALVDRGTCTFIVKALNAQAAGAIGVLVANNTSPGLPPMGGVDPTVTITSIGISQADGSSIKANLPGVNATITIDSTLLEGADSQGRVRLYAPNPIESGSSLSHWDIVASPNLLMEPFINDDLTTNVDLTDEQMADIGWTLNNPAVCGNGLREGAEECDGADLGGATCGDISCSGGSVSCTASCTLDYSSCSGCPVCNFNGICEIGEDCGNCASDCISGTSGGASCGNGICEAGNGEDCVSCPSDCRGVQGGKPANRYCCGDGDGSNPVTCADSRCTSGGFQCTSVPVGGGTSYCCGDLVCEGAENSSNCSLDCGP